MSSRPLLSVKDLTVRFGDFDAVNGISFDVQEGEVVCIVGESGSGKSVTGRALIGLLDDSARRGGEILLRDEHLENATDARLCQIRGKQISMIFQEPMTALNPAKRVGDQISEMMLSHLKISLAESKRRTIDLLTRVGIQKPDVRAMVFPHQLSGGMRQRVMIAIACAANPSLIIADEPTTALDVTVQAQVLDLLFDMQRELGSSVIFVTHDLGVVAEIADRVIVLYRGQIVEQGGVEQIFKNPKHPYTRALLAAAPDVDLPPQKGFRFPTVDTGSIFDGKPARVKAEPRVKAERVKHQPDQPAQGLAKDPAAALELSGVRRDFVIASGFPFGKMQMLSAVDGVDLKVAPGTTTALIGESGSGKSTLGRCAARLDRPTAGKIFYQGADVSSIRGDTLKAFRRKVQTIFQDPYASLNPRRTVGDAIADGLAIHGIGDAKEREERVADLLRRVELDPSYAKRFPHQFSGGQRQRVAIARALALEPEFIIADEAVSALDVSVRAQILNLLADLQEERKLAFLFITHDLSTVRQFADRVAIMRHGRIVEEGATESVFNDPQEDYTRTLLGAVPRTHFDAERRLRPVRLRDGEATGIFQ